MKNRHKLGGNIVNQVQISNLGINQFVAFSHLLSTRRLFFCGTVLNIVFSN